MKPRYFFYLLFAVLGLCPLISSAQASKNKDLVSVSKIEFKKLQKSEISRTNGSWIRIEIMLNAISDAQKKTSNNAMWIRNVGVTLTLVYEDNKDKKRGNARQKIVMKESVKIFAVEANKMTPVAFYIPPEAYSIYGIQKAEPFAWSIDLSVDGVKIPLSRDNYKQLLSKKISSSGNVPKIMESYNKLVESAVVANKGVLMSMPNAPFQVQWYELGKVDQQNLPLPTYIKEN